MATAPPTETKRQQSIDLRRTEQLVHQYLNDRRAERLPALSHNSRAAAAAREHARDMATEGYFSHTDPSTGETQRERYSFCTRGGGENIHQTWVYRNVRKESGTVYHTSAEDLAQGIVMGWMSSKPHREKGIYGRLWTVGGAGIAISDTGKVYAVYGFCAK